MIAARDAQIAALRQENELLRRKVDHILRQLFGKKSEALDPAQLELLLEADAAKKSDAAGDAPAAEPQAAASRHPRQRKPRDTSRLEVVEEVIVPAPVKACPEAWRKIGEAVSELLDYPCMQAGRGGGQAAPMRGTASAAGGCQLQGSRTDRSSWLVICGRRVSTSVNQASGSWPARTAFSIMV